jgi:hypothetical protein
VELKQFVALEERPETYSLPTISARVQIGCMDAAKVQNAVGDSLIEQKLIPTSVDRPHSKV